MEHINFTDLDLRTPEIKTTLIKVNGDTELRVRSYLPIAEKGEFIQFIINGAIDNFTGCFSPVRLEAYFSLAICHWYARIDFTDDDLLAIDKTYDLLEANEVVDAIIVNIPEDEFNFISELVEDTIKDIASYNASFAGVLNSLNMNTDDLNGQIKDLLDKIKDNEGIETLSVIKDVVGKD